MKYITFFALLLGALLTAQASDSPVGLWRTIDDKTGKEKSLVRVVEVNGEFKASIGMTIMTGLKKTGSEYEGGEILDPANGKIYRCKMWTAEGGKKLNVRGFVGVAVLGRTQVWLREE
jgi:uncharacterized protein (DUF2147 family)